MRNKIYQTTYWKEHCFGLSAEMLVDKAVDLKAVGGCSGGFGKPTHFLCLALKMLQIQPDPDIIIEFIRNEDYKYVRLLGACGCKSGCGRPAVGDRLTGGSSSRRLHGSTFVSLAAWQQG